jgi:tryptophanyl-tRNA synthetase
MKKSFKVTPWEVSGEIDYERIITEFGVSKIDDSLIEKLTLFTIIFKYAFFL